MNSSQTARLVQDAALQPRSQNVEFGFAHRAFEAKKQPIIKVSWIVNAILIQDQGVGERADLEQAMPVHRVARQTRHLKAEHDACTAKADLGDEALKTFPISGRSSGLSQIRIDNNDLILRPAQSNGMLSKTILSFCAFDILEYLAKCGLPNIEEGSPFQMSWFDFLVRVRSHTITFEAL